MSAIGKSPGPMDSADSAHRTDPTNRPASRTRPLASGAGASPGASPGTFPGASLWTFPWAMRVAWLALPLAAGPVLGDAMAGASRPVQVVASLGLWGGWAAVLLATLVPRTVSLTVVRIAAPAAGAAVLAATLASDEAAGWRVVGLSWAVATAAVAFAPATGQAFVDGSSYGDEHRFPLRVPAALLVGPLPLTWAAVVAGATTGPLLLAARQWVVGGVVLVVGVGAMVWGFRVLHNLSRRWVVLVPGGLVLHDPLALTDPVLFRRGTIRRIGPAPADTTALDLTRGALGLAVEVELIEPAPLTLAPTGPRHPRETVETDRVLFTPTRPGVLLTATRTRRLG